MIHHCRVGLSRFSSPRARRRALWAAALVVAGAVGAIVFLALPNEKGGISDTTPTGTVQVVRRARQVPLPASARASIDELLDRFVPAAMSRRHPERAFDLVTPSMRKGMSRADWRAGNLPVQPYDARGTSFHDWRLVSSYPGVVTLELTLQPRDRSEGAAAYLVDVKPVRGRWLVDSAYQRASYAPAPATTEASGATKTTAAPASGGGDKGRIATIWLLLPLGLLSLIVIVPTIVFTAGWIADKRVERRTRDDPRRQLPPLPKPRRPDDPPKPSD
jgi:hypothetical protein